MDLNANDIVVVKSLTQSKPAVVGTLSITDSETHQQSIASFQVVIDSPGWVYIILSNQEVLRLPFGWGIRIVQQKDKVVPVVNLTHLTEIFQHHKMKVVLGKALASRIAKKLAVDYSFELSLRPAHQVQVKEVKLYMPGLEPSPQAKTTKSVDFTLDLSKAQDIQNLRETLSSLLCELSFQGDLGHQQMLEMTQEIHQPATRVGMVYDLTSVA